MGKKAKRGGGHGPPISTRSSPAVMLQGVMPRPRLPTFSLSKGPSCSTKREACHLIHFCHCPPPPQPSGYLSSSSQIK